MNFLSKLTCWLSAKLDPTGNLSDAVCTARRVPEWADLEMRRPRMEKTTYNHFWGVRRG